MKAELKADTLVEQRGLSSVVWMVVSKAAHLAVSRVELKVFRMVGPMVAL